MYYITRLSLDIEKGWPIAKADAKGPLVFYMDYEKLAKLYDALVERTKITDAALHRFYTTFSDDGLREAQGGMVIALAENKIRLGQLEMPSDYGRGRDFNSSDKKASGGKDICLHRNMQPNPNDGYESFCPACGMQWDKMGQVKI